MKANAAPVLAIFEKKMRLEIPLFQRQYVWNLNQQWEPLWEDISRKFSEYLEGRKDAPVHFLGAMVLDQKQTPTTHVERRQIIDGQQRLTTLQIFLAAFRDFCSEQNCVELAREADNFVQNKGMMADPDIDRFKVWPTQSDREQFKAVITSGSRAELEKRFPIIKRKYARSPDPRPRMVEAYLFFYKQIATFFMDCDGEVAIASEVPLPIRLEECFQALKNSLMIVAIDLEQDDDAQVIFETLNARGEPLLPADLLRNYIFLRAARKNESQEALYKEFWQGFEEPFWREIVTQGRLYRPRSDLFMQHFLSSRLLTDIPVKHLFIEYKFWIERQKPFDSVRDELFSLAISRDNFRRLIQPKHGDPIHDLAILLQAFDVSTVYPFLIYILGENLSSEQIAEIGFILSSYFVRRAVCGLTNKNYNRVFTNAIKFLRSNGANFSNLRTYLRALKGDTVEWPDDGPFAEAWSTKHAYHTLNNAKLVYILKRLSDTYLTPKHEPITIHGPLSVEHIMPQGWLASWPLPDGAKGLTQQELWSMQPDDPRAAPTRRRNALVQTLGNLTIVTQQLNSAASNGPWESKRAALGASLLPINHTLAGIQVWDEVAIERRSRELFEKARLLWGGPSAGALLGSQAA